MNYYPKTANVSDIHTLKGAISDCIKAVFTNSDRINDFFSKLEGPSRRNGLTLSYPDDSKSEVVTARASFPNFDWESLDKAESEFVKELDHLWLTLDRATLI